MKHLYIGVYLVLTSLFVQAEAPEPARSLYDAIGTFSNISADFNQTITDRSGLVVQESKGRFILARPNMIYWQTLPPYEQEIYGDGRVLWVYDADLEQATKYPNGELLRGPMTLFSESFENMNARFSVDKELIPEGQATSDSSRTRYLLTPKESQVDNGFSALAFEFQKAQLSRIEIHDKLRQVTRLSLTNVRVNDTLAGDTFKFSVPKGVDILVNE